MTTKKQSPIKLAEVIQESEKFDVMSTYQLDAENNRVIKYNKYFDHKKIEELVLELYEDMKYVVENEIEFFENDEQLLKYELLLIIKTFSHFKDEIGSSFDEKIHALEVLMKIGLYDLFFEEIFDENQVLEVIEQVNLVAERAIAIESALEKEKKKIK
ncbi:hypothetical protein ACIQ1D_19395 [Lysinibacillus xylanilyticus]|uniref:hypothetical protein n=1 Tax=Lysinibacillus xylanilyticus TaxID=582475 RepID=UPI00380A7958